MPIRQAMFETNSSTSHAFVIKDGNIIKPDLTKEEIDTGIIHVYPDIDDNNTFVKWVDDDDPYYQYIKDFKSKLSYVMTSIIDHQLCGENIRQSDISESDVNDSENECFVMLKEVVKDTLGMQLIFHKESNDHWDPWGCIDASCGEADENDIFSSKECLKLFLFSDKSYVESFG